MLTYHEFAKYGTQTTFYFALEDITDAEAPFTGVAPLTGDIWITKDGGAAANATNAFVAISNGLYSWTATATEMQATRLLVNVYDATASAIFKPITVLILTRMALGTLDVDATQIGGNTTAFACTGVGTGKGINSTSTATGNYHNLFDVTYAEPSALVTASSGIGLWMLTMARRWLNKTTQTSSTFTQYKDDDSTALYTRTVADTGGTATLGPAV